MNKHKLVERSINSWRPTERRFVQFPPKFEYFDCQPQLTGEDRDILTSILQTSLKGKGGRKAPIDHCFAVDTPEYVCSTLGIEIRDLGSRTVSTFITDEEQQRSQLTEDMFKDTKEVISRLHLPDPNDPNEVYIKIRNKVKRLRDNVTIRRWEGEMEVIPISLIAKIRDEIKNLFEHASLCCKIDKDFYDIAELLDEAWKQIHHSLGEAIIHNDEGTLLEINCVLDKLHSRLEDILAPATLLPVAETPFTRTETADSDDNRKRVDYSVDILGQYVRCDTNDRPVIQIDLKKIERHAQKDGQPREYLLAIVFTHELMHALLDRFPYAPNCDFDFYIREIDEPLAEYGMLTIIDQLNDPKLSEYAWKHVFDERFSNGTACYSLGAELFLIKRLSGQDVFKPLFAYYALSAKDDSGLPRDVKALDSYIDAFRVSFPADRASAYWCLRDLCDLLKLGTGSNAKKIKKAIKDCVDIIYTD